MIYNCQLCKGEGDLSGLCQARQDLFNGHKSKEVEAARVAFIERAPYCALLGVESLLPQRSKYHLEILLGLKRRLENDPESGLDNCVRSYLSQRADSVLTRDNLRAIVEEKISGITNNPRRPKRHESYVDDPNTEKPSEDTIQNRILQNLD